MISRRITRIDCTKQRLAIEPRTLQHTCETKFVFADHVSLVFVADDPLDKVDKCARAQSALFEGQKKTLKMPAPREAFRQPDDVGFASADLPYDVAKLGQIDRADQAIIDEV